MSRNAWLIGSIIVVWSMTLNANGQVPVPPPPEPANQTDQSSKAGERAADANEAQKETDASVKKPGLRFPAGGFKGNDDRVPLPQLIDRLNEQQQEQQRVQREQQQRAGANNFNVPQNQFGVQPPIYVPGYNPNRPYGYPGYIYPGYGYGYPGYGYVYPGYGYGYGYWSGPGIGVLRPGAVGGDTFFGNPHASQYFGNPHASQGK